MVEAIRIGCTAADVHSRCSYPDCACTQIPRAIQAAVGFAVKDAATELKANIVGGITEAFRHGR
jgi:hypothetical protein